jgi:predicted AlkP superfamily phosphohydrolase/phosphomutase
MMSGRSPGELGIYGFRNRVDHTYDGLAIATSRSVQVPRIWDLMGAAGRESVVLGVPGTYPPAPLRGILVSDFLAPSTKARFTYPDALRHEVQRVTGGYVLDVADFRTDDKSRVAQQVFDMTEQRFGLARYLASTRGWDFMAFVDMGPDRLHHAFWSYCDPEHPRYEPGNPYAQLFRDYYRALDRHIAAFLEVLDDDVTVVVASDHGGQRMVGGFCLNEWLRQENLLVLHSEPCSPVSISGAEIDWQRTLAWGDGGYYGRIFLNVEGREPSGAIPASQYEDVRDNIKARLEAVADHTGAPMGNRVLRPEEVYPEVMGVPPDLIAYLGNLRWRAAGTLGLGEGLYTFKNDTGPDDANHAEDGVLVMAGPGIGVGACREISILDVAPTLQSVLGLSAPVGQRGRVLI